MALYSATSSSVCLPVLAYSEGRVLLLDEEGSSLRRVVTPLGAGGADGLSARVVFTSVCRASLLRSRLSRSRLPGSVRCSALPELRTPGLRDGDPSSLVALPETRSELLSRTEELFPPCPLEEFVCTRTAGASSLPPRAGASYLRDD